MQTLSFNENPSSRAECLTNIRKALKLIDKFNWDEHDILDADPDTTIEIYKFFKDKYKHTYAMKNVLWINVFYIFCYNLWTIWLINF